MAFFKCIFVYFLLFAFNAIAMEKPNFYNEPARATTYSIDDYEKNNFADDQFTFHLFTNARKALSCETSVRRKDQSMLLHLKTLEYLSESVRKFHPAQYLLGTLAEEVGDRSCAKKLYELAAKGNYVPAQYRLLLMNLFSISQPQYLNKSGGLFSYYPGQSLFQLYYQTPEVTPYDPLNLFGDQAHKDQLVALYQNLISQKLRKRNSESLHIQTLQPKMPAMSEYEIELCDTFLKRINDLDNNLVHFKNIIESKEYTEIHHLSDIHYYPAYLCSIFWIRMGSALSTQQIKLLKMTTTQVWDQSIQFFIKAIQNNIEGLTESSISLFKEEGEKASISLAAFLSAYLKTTGQKGEMDIFHALQDYVCGHYMPAEHRERNRSMFTENYTLIKLLLQDREFFPVFDELIDARAVLKSMSYDVFVSYLAELLSPAQKFSFGKLLLKQNKVKEGRIYICKAAMENCKEAVWDCLRIMLEDNFNGNVDYVIEMMTRAVDAYNDDCDRENVKNIFQKLHEEASSNKNAAQFLADCFDHGWDGFIAPKNEEFLVHKLKSMNEGYTKLLLQAQLFIHEKKYNKAFLLLKSIVEGADDVSIKKGACNLIANINGEIALDQQYKNICLIFPVDRDLAMDELIRIEYELQTNKQTRTIEEMDLLFSSGLFQQLKSVAHENGFVAFHLASALAARVEYNLNVHGKDFDIETDGQEVLRLLDYVQEARYEPAEEDNSIEDLRIFIEFNLGLHHFSAGNYKEAAYYLKSSVKKGNKQAMAFYGALCLKGIIDLPGINTQNYGLQMLKDVLLAGSGSISSMVKKSIINHYESLLKEQCGMAIISKTRKDYLELIPYLGKQKAKYAEKIVKDMRYYNFDEILQKYEDTAIAGNPEALNEIGMAYYRNGQNEQASEYIFDAMHEGSIRAYFNYAMLIHEGKIEGTSLDIANCLDIFLKKVLVSRSTFENEHDAVESARYILASAASRDEYMTAFYVAARHDLRLFELTKKRMYADSAAHILASAELKLFNPACNDKNGMPALEDREDFKLLIADAEQIALKHSLPELAFSLATIHQSRFVQEKSFLGSHLEHLPKAQSFFELAYKQRCKNQVLCSKHISELYDFAASIHLREHKYIEAKKCFEKSLTYNKTNAKVLFVYGKFLIEHYKDFNFSQKRGFSEGIKNLKSAIAAGSIKAQGFLAHHYISVESYGAQEREKGFHLMYELAQKDEGVSDAAKLDLAEWFLEGRGCEPNPDEAEKCLLSLNNTNDDLAKLFLGICYYKKAIKYNKPEYYKNAANIFETLLDREYVCHGAHLFLSKLHISGVLGIRSLDLAIKHFDKFLDCGNSIVTISKRLEELKILDDFSNDEDHRIPFLKCKYCYLIGSTSPEFRDKLRILEDIEFYISIVGQYISWNPQETATAGKPDLLDDYAKMHAFAADLYASVTILSTIDTKATTFFAQKSFSHLVKALNHARDEDGNCRIPEVKKITQEIIRDFGTTILYKPELVQTVNQLINIIYAKFGVKIIQTGDY